MVAGVEAAGATVVVVAAMAEVVVVGTKVAGGWVAMVVWEVVAGAGVEVVACSNFTWRVYV
jgi:hypothetical protein